MAQTLPKDGIERSIREVLASSVYQLLAVSFCVLLGLAMIANNQLAGEATWFWYATLFHHGAKLYADLHLALQPLLIMEMDAWMNLFGRKLLVTEIPSLLHLLIMCLGLFLLLRESDWPDWQKAIVMAGSFVLWTAGQSYRFDDYHVTTESFILYSLVLLLFLAKAEGPRRQLVLALALGILCGLTMTSRLNDGAALLTSTFLCTLVLTRSRKLLISFVFVVTTALTAILILKVTGDSFPDYLSNSVIRAVGSKGGTGSILADPILLFRNALEMPLERKWILSWLAVIVAAGALAQRYWKNNVEFILAVQLALAGAAFALTTHQRRVELLTGTLPQFLVLFLTVASYAVALILVTQYSVWKMGYRKWEWDAREILLLVPLAELASISTSAAATPLSGYYSPLAMLLLLVPVIRPFRKQATWVNASFLTMLVLLGFAGTTAKIHSPYAWDNQPQRPMFLDRQWYQHPVYGPMYIDRDQLQFIQSICAEIDQGGSRPELLSLPFSYPNYFCDTPPWHGYVQTFFDITTRSTIEKMIGEVQTAPPQWIVYQRQLQSMGVLEGVFNHGQPLAQRELDELIMQRIATGQWQLIDKKNYLMGEGWYVIRTRP